MSDEQYSPSGPVMLVATNMMRPPPTRIGKIGKDFTFGRTIPLMSLIAGGVGAVLGLFLALPFGSLQAFAIGAILGAIAGVAAVTLSPIKGESFAKWLGLSAAAFKAPKVEINGRNAKVYIGIAPLAFTAAGKVDVIAGAAEVTLGSVDERGVLIPQSAVLTEHRKKAAEIASARGMRWDDTPKKSLPRQNDSTFESRKNLKPQKEEVKESKSNRWDAKGTTGGNVSSMREETQRKVTEVKSTKATNERKAKPAKLPANKTTKLTQRK